MLLLKTQKEFASSSKELEYSTFFIDDRITNIVNILIDNEFIREIDSTQNKRYELTEKGNVASQIQEVNCLAFSEIICSGALNELSVKELVAVLSSFVSLRIPEELRSFYCECEGIVENVMKDLNWYMDKYYDIQLNTIGDIDEQEYSLVYDIQSIMMDWCDTKSEKESKEIIDFLLTEKEIFLGEFVKCVLKINNIAHELESVCDSIGNVELKHKLSQIPELTLKFVATNQSLYI